VSTRALRSLAAFALSAVTSALVASIVLAAVDNGTQNGLDSAVAPWLGKDNPDGVTGSYSVDNGFQDATLREWIEPAHDWMKDGFMKWGAAAEAKLNNETNTRALGAEMRIHDQTFYNFVGNWNSNLPWSKGAEGENAAEELFQGYTEVDIEVKDPWKINAGFNYFWEIKIDSEKASTANTQFYTEIEYCNKDFATNCNWDETGRFRKRVLQQ